MIAQGPLKLSDFVSFIAFTAVPHVCIIIVVKYGRVFYRSCTMLENLYGDTLFLADEDDEEEEEKADAVDGGQMVKTTVSSEPCPLDYRTQLLIMIIFSEDMFANQMTSMRLGKVHECISWLFCLRFLMRVTDKWCEEWVKITKSF